MNGLLGFALTSLLPVAAGLLAIAGGTLSDAIRRRGGTQ